MADHLATKTHPTVSPEEWQAARDELLALEKEHPSGRRAGAQAT